MPIIIASSVDMADDEGAVEQRVPGAFSSPNSSWKLASVGVKIQFGG